MISVSHILAFTVDVLLAVALPIGLLIGWHKKTGAKFSAAAAGAGMFALFALVLEGMLHAVVLRPDGYVMQHAWSYVLYGSLAAGVFEETGRFVAFKFLLKKQNGRESSVMYGLGHGGFEALVVGVTLLSNLIFAVTYNMGMYAGNADAETAAQTILGTSALTLLAGGFERISALCVQLSLSVFVFTAVKRGKLWLFPAAILAHALVDASAALYQYKVISNIWAVEGIVFVLAAVLAVAAYKLYQSDSCPAKG